MMVLHNNEPFAPYDLPLISPQPTPQTWIEISSSAFNHNIAYYKNRIGHHNKLAIVIKGNAYGHGLQQIATLCKNNDLIDWICVAQLSEALAVYGVVDKPVLIFGYSDVDPECAVGKNIHFMIDHLEYAQQLNAIGKKYSHPFKVHVKVDTGLSRMGILADEILPFIHKLQQLDHLSIAGVYSHFSESDSNPDLTAQQLAQYNQVLALLHKNNIFPEYVHMSNSASISTVEYPCHFNFFRIGIGAYGLGHDRDPLQPIMTWKTRIAHIKMVPSGSLISYTGSFQTTRTTRLALLPVGYYDGYEFRFSNKTFVLINGCYAPVIGRIAMNMTIIDITDIIANKNDEVTLLGTDPLINAHHLASVSEIKNVREIITGINAHIARIIR
jgi:alanine racemase